MLVPLTNLGLGERERTYLTGMRSGITREGQGKRKGERVEICKRSKIVRCRYI